MDEGRVERRRQQLLAVLRGHLDEIAEHVVVAHLERAHAGLVGVARLQRRDHAARFVAQARASRRAPRRIRRARSRRRASGTAVRRRAPRRASRRSRHPARPAPARRPRSRPACSPSVPSRAPARRPPPARRGSPRDRAGRRAAAPAARASAQDPAPPASCARTSARAAASATNSATASRRRAIAAGSVSGAASRCAEQPRAGRRHGAVDASLQRAAPLARQRAHQFEVGARRRIDHQRRADGLARRRRERRPRAELRALHIGDAGGGRGQLQPRERAEGFRGRDREISGEPPLGGRAVEHVARRAASPGSSRRYGAMSASP